jgi:uncharacterized protein
MVVLGYIGALIMGLVLGLIGGGGSILTVPILVYLFSVDKVTATAYSLFVVGSTAAVGSVSHVRQGNINWSSALWFGAPSIAAVFATRAWLMPALPDTFGPVSKGTALLILFALLMLAAAITMVRRTTPVRPTATRGNALAIGLTLLEGAAVGTLTGLVGAGGGFLIIPALVVLGGLGMKQAIGTSLVIIAAKSLIGFSGDLLTGPPVDWSLLLSCTGVAVVGILIGSALGARIPGDRLKPAFGWFVLVMGAGILVTELF